MPVAPASFRHDIVVEANAVTLPSSLNATMASMDDGTANPGTNRYQQGYNVAAPSTGLPAPGSMFTNAGAADHRYVLPSSDASNNVIRIDADNPTAAFALSGTSGGIKPIVNVQPVSTNVFAGSSVLFSVGASGTPPLQFQWQRATNSAFANLTNGGSVAGAATSNLTLSTTALADAGSYQVLIRNASGASTSAVVRLNVLSTATDVTAPGDEITSIGGASPDAETAANVIDNTTSKYLNFGTDSDQAAPFVGPVGLIVTPSIGSTVVTGLRVYTANDAVDRDPVDYRLEGAIGVGATNFTQIASGVLTLPEARNAAALELDPVGQANQEVLFPNTAGYISYRLTFTSVKNNTNANSLQIGEIELLGTAGPGMPTAQLSVNQVGAGSLLLTSSRPGLLQSTMALTGAGTVWDDVGPISGAVTIMPSRTARFYRVSLPPP